MKRLATNCRRAVLAVALATAAFAATAAQADAGTYTVHTCKTPEGDGASTGEWRVTTHNGSVNKHSTACASGPFSLQMLSSVSHSWDDYIHATYRAPANTSIDGYSMWRSVQLSYPYNYRYYHLGHGNPVEYDACYPTRSCRSRGTTHTPLGSSNRVSSSGISDVSGLAISLSCGYDASHKSCPADAPAAEFQLHRADIKLLDRTAPVLASPPTGPLVQSGNTAMTGVVPVSLSATDRGGGVYQALFEVDGRVVDTATIDPNGGACKPPFTSSIPCKLSAGGTVGMDTSKVSDGTHKLRILVNDVTGTNTTSWGPITIRTANSSCNPSPRKSVPSLRMRAAIVRGKGRKARSSRSVTARFGSRYRVKGRLTTKRGTPLRGAPVCVAARHDRSRAPVRGYAHMRTDKHGRFSYTLRRGPSRRVWFVYRVSGGALRSSVLVHVRAPVSMRSSRRQLRNGQSVLLGGKVRGAPRGVLVELQAKRGGRWQTFGTTHTSRKSRYRFRYRFTRTSGVQRYLLRARVGHQSTYPYAAGGSRTVALKVSG